MEEIKQSLKQDELFSKHAHLEQAHKDEIQELTSKGIDFDIALMQIEKRDPTIAERAKAQTTNFTDWQVSVQTRTYTQEDMSKLTQSEFESVYNLSKEGKVKII